MSSIGIAASTTMLGRHRQMYDNIPGSQINPYSLGSQQMLGQLRAGFLAGGSDPATAAHRSYALEAYLVGRQSSMLAFIDVFRLLGIIFILIIPLIWLMKPPRLRKGDIDLKANIYSLTVEKNVADAGHDPFVACHQRIIAGAPILESPHRALVRDC